MKNTELARLVVVYVLANPERHNQNDWVDKDYGIRINSGDATAVCPTTACLAGWSLYLHGGSVGVAEQLCTAAWSMAPSSVRNELWYEAAAECLGIDTVVDDDSGVRSTEAYILHRIFLGIADNTTAIEMFTNLFDLDYEECVLEAKRMVEMDESLIVTDLTVKTADPKLLDETIQQLPGCTAVVVDGSHDGTACTVRVFSGLEFLKYALTKQGYGEITTEKTL